jgi:hypothetical protein
MQVAIDDDRRAGEIECPVRNEEAGSRDYPLTAGGLAWGDFLADTWTLTSRYGVADVLVSVEGNGHQ